MDLKALLENFEIAFKTSNGSYEPVYTEVFRNPSPKEFLEASKTVQGKPYIRFIAPKNGSTVFVFRPDVFHDGVSGHLESKKLVSGQSRHNLWGTAVFEDGKWNFDGSDEGVPLDFNWEALASKGIHKTDKETDGSVNPADIKEAFEAAFTHPVSKEYVEVFSNPSAKEMNEAAREMRGQVYLRFIADGDAKRLYVFSPLVIHRAAAKQIKRYSGKGNIGLPKKKDLWGVAKRIGGSWKAITSDIIEGVDDMKDDVLEQDWSWLNKKIDVTPLLDKIKEDQDTSSEHLEPAQMRRKAKKLKVEESLNVFAEEFVGGKKAAGTYIEIFKNPKFEELRAIPQNVRFAIDGRKNKIDVYIWGTNLLHEDAAKKIGIPYPHNEIIYGIGMGSKKPSQKILSMGGEYGIRKLVDHFERTPNKEKRKKLLQQIENYTNTSKWSNKWVDLKGFFKSVEEVIQRLKSEVNEAFETYAGKGEDTVIFKSPTASEMREFGQYLRFIIHNNSGKKDVYVFADGLMHAKAADELGVSYPNDPNVLAGVAVKKGKEWVMIDSFNLRNTLGKSVHNFMKMLETNWSNPYIKVEDYMNKQATKKSR